MALQAAAQKIYNPKFDFHLNTNVQNVNWDNREIYKTFSLKIIRTKFSSS